MSSAFSLLVAFGIAASAACGGGSAAPGDGGLDKPEGGEVGGADVRSDGAGSDGKAPDTCAEAGCAPHQVCDLSGSTGPICKSSCEPGFTWDAAGGRCNVAAGKTCGVGPSSISPECDAINRTCQEVGGSAMCGECLLGFIADGWPCRPPTSCAECDSRHRACDPSSATASCGGCATGFVETLGGTCVAPPNGCDPATADGGCPLCAVGQGWDPAAGGCRACLDGVPTMCKGAGETGNVVITASQANARCICETRDGFYPGSAGGAAQPCDSDGDGWVRESAQPANENENAVIRLNARCNLLTVDRMVLQGESGTTKEIALAAPLPLYESDRNDGATASGADLIPPYGTRALSHRALNAFTKACVTTTADHNHNGLPDVDEWAGDSGASGAFRAAVAASGKLAGYYQQYARFSYYLELHNGGYEAVAGSSRGLYRIKERTRQSGGNTSAAVPLAVAGGSSSYWRSCKRHVDSLYRGSTTRSFAGGDFAALQASGATDVMLHASQFKCVTVKSAADYRQGGYDAAMFPQVVFMNGTAVIRTKGGNDETLPWTPNDCSLMSETAVPGPVGPALPVIACTAPASVVTDHAYWMVVGYENAANTAAGDYVRGCINECAELGTMACPNFVPVPAGSGRFTCYSNAVGQYGQIACGCGVPYGGANCEIGCPASDLFRSEPYVNMAQRGYWLCGRPMASDGAVLRGGQYVLRGGIPIAPVSGTLEGGNYTLRAE